MTATDAVAALVARTTAAQGLPPAVSDPVALARVAALVLARNGNGAPKGAGTTISLDAHSLLKGGRNVDRTP